MKHNSFRSRFFIPAFGLFSILTGCVTNNNQSPKFQQYYAQGELLYIQHCSNCHQKTGTGLGLLYPPLNTSDYMDHHFNETICLIKNGTNGEMAVNEKKFNHEMPGLPLLTDLEIAEITTYIYNSWGRQHGLVDVNEVAKALPQCKK